MQELIRVHVLVVGRVQGVFFRAECAEQARMRGACGWVRNTADGSVEAVFEGPAPTVDAMVTWCRTGPRSARVNTVETWSEPPQALTTFAVIG